MSCVSEFAPEFRAQGFRMTPQRMTILHVLRHAGGHLTPPRSTSRPAQNCPG